MQVVHRVNLSRRYLSKECLIINSRLKAINAASNVKTNLGALSTETHKIPQIHRNLRTSLLKDINEQNEWIEAKNDIFQISYLSFLSLSIFNCLNFLWFLIDWLNIQGVMVIFGVSDSFWAAKWMQRLINELLYYDINYSLLYCCALRTSLR